LAIAASQIALWLVVLTNLVLTIAIIRRLNADGGTSRAGLHVGAPAPSFSASTLDGKTITSKDLRRRTVLLFLSPGCPPCTESLPEYVRLSAMSKSSGTELLIVSSGDAPSTRQMLAEARVQGDMLVAPRAENTFFDNYKISATPQFILVQDRRVLLSGAPFMASDTWKSLVNAWEQTERSAGVPESEPSPV
jgi:peroxiredoxin